MRSKLRKVLVQRFAILIKEKLPQFERITNEIIPQECHLYGWQATSNLFFYLCLQTHRIRDDYTIEVGLSEKGRWPHSHLSGPYNSMENGELRFRLVTLFRRDNKDVWWSLDKHNTSTVLDSPKEAVERLRSFHTFPPTPIEECMKEIEPQLQDSVEKVIQYAHPYFNEIIAQGSKQSH